MIKVMSHGVIIPYNITSALIVLSHNDRGVLALIVSKK